MKTLLSAATANAFSGFLVILPLAILLIAGLEVYDLLEETAAFAGLQLPFPGIRHEQKVAVVGSGPAGISCAHFLLRAGIGVEMYERAERPGGLLTYGIPGFKLDKGIIERRFKLGHLANIRHNSFTLSKAIGFSRAGKTVTEQSRIAR